jgi:hypothetical protein
MSIRTPVNADAQDLPGFRIASPVLPTVRVPLCAARLRLGLT